MLFRCWLIVVWSPLYIVQWTTLGTRNPEAFESTNSTQCFWDSVPPQIRYRKHHRTNRRVRSGSRGARQTRLARKTRQTGRGFKRERQTPQNTGHILCRKMTRHEIHASAWVSDEESNDEKSGPTTVVPPRPWKVGGCKAMSRQWRKILCKLTRTQARGNVQPQIGQTCLIVKGTAGQDEGQMGIVTNVTRVRVDVTFIPKSGVGTVTKSKQPSSLIFLATGLTIVQDEYGSVWVKATNRNPTTA
jgi:hypothetical protein